MARQTKAAGMMISHRIPFLFLLLWWNRLISRAATCFRTSLKMRLLVRVFHWNGWCYLLPLTKVGCFCPGLLLLVSTFSSVSPIGTSVSVEEHILIYISLSFDKTLVGRVHAKKRKHNWFFQNMFALIFLDSTVHPINMCNKCRKVRNANREEKAGQFKKRNISRSAADTFTVPLCVN